MTTANLQKLPGAVPQESAASGKPEYHAPVERLTPREPLLTRDQMLDLLDFSAAKHLGSL